MQSFAVQMTCCFPSMLCAFVQLFLSLPAGSGTTVTDLSGPGWMPGKAALACLTHSAE